MTLISKQLPLCIRSFSYLKQFISYKISIKYSKAGSALDFGIVINHVNQIQLDLCYK